MRRSSLQQLAHCEHLPTSTRQGNVGCATTCAVSQNVIEVTILNSNWLPLRHVLYHCRSFSLAIHMVKPVMRYNDPLPFLNVLADSCSSHSSSVIALLIGSVLLSLCAVVIKEKSPAKPSKLLFGTSCMEMNNWLHHLLHDHFLVHC